MEKIILKMYRRVMAIM